MNNTCVYCGEIIPEGRQVCTACDKPCVEVMAKDICPINMDCIECHLYENGCHAKKYARRAYAKGYRKQEWISVDERLPDRCGRFLVYVKDTHSSGVILVSYAPKYTFGEQSLMGRAVWFAYDSEWGDYEIKGVTHWMPLPEAPKKGGAE